jgi:hypothetical protein
MQQQGPPPPPPPRQPGAIQQQQQPLPPPPPPHASPNNQLQQQQQQQQQLLQQDGSSIMLGPTVSAVSPAAFAAAGDTDAAATAQQLSELQLAAQRESPAGYAGSSSSASPSLMLASSSSSSPALGVTGGATVTTALPVWGPSVQLGGSSSSRGQRAVSGKNPFAGVASVPISCLHAAPQHTVVCAYAARQCIT